MKEPNTCGIVVLAIVIVLVLLGINEAGGLEGAKQDILAALRVLK